MTGHMDAKALEALRRGRQSRRQRDIESCRLVCNAPFRERFVQLCRERRTSASVVCEGMGWMRPTPPSYLRERPNSPLTRPDVIRLRRVLGMAKVPKDPRGVRPAYYRENVSYDTAVRLADLLGLDPVEVGL